MITQDRETYQNLSNIKLQAAVGSDSLLEKFDEYEWLIYPQLLSRNEIDSVKIQPLPSLKQGNRKRLIHH
ncbi:MAG: hypothetical protein IPH11_10135 [Ignavibacteriales bacterium]|nr:hypothetical protein [Ignavibacteriales bacterium]